MQPIAHQTFVCDPVKTRCTSKNRQANMETLTKNVFRPRNSNNSRHAKLDNITKQRQINREMSYFMPWVHRYRPKLSQQMEMQVLGLPDDKFGPPNSHPHGFYGFRTFPQVFWKGASGWVWGIQFIGSHTHVHSRCF